MTTPDDITPSGSVLAISVGNTNTALAACIDGEPVHRVTMPNTSLDAIAKAATAAAEEHAIDIAVLATVNRTVSDKLIQTLQANPELQVLQIGVDLGIGQGKATVWTCDLTKEYVAINGDYRS